MTAVTFIIYLARIPNFELKLGQLVYPPNPPGATPYEKGVDVRLATDMLVHAARNNYDTAILVSGDADFADMVQAVKDWGKNVKIVLFGRDGSRVLRDVADRIIEVDPSFLDDCWRQ